MVATPKLQYCVKTHPSQSNCNYFVLYSYNGEHIAFFMTPDGRHKKVTQWFYTLDFFIQAVKNCKLYSMSKPPKSLDIQAKKVVIKWHHSLVESKV